MEKCGVKDPWKDGFKTLKEKSFCPWREAAFTPRRAQLRRFSGTFVFFYCMDQKGAPYLTYIVRAQAGEINLLESFLRQEAILHQQLHLKWRGCNGWYFCSPLGPIRIFPTHWFLPPLVHIQLKFSRSLWFLQCRQIFYGAQNQISGKMSSQTAV